MFSIETLHESMDRSLQLLVELTSEQRSAGAGALLRNLERDLGAERRLLSEMNLRVPGITGVDPLAMLQRGELDRLIAQLRRAVDGDDSRWFAALAELRLQLDTAFVAVDLALPEPA